MFEQHADGAEIDDMLLSNSHLVICTFEIQYFLDASDCSDTEYHIN